MQNEIAIIDFGGQYTHLIARRIRNLGIFSEIYQPESFQIGKHIKGIIFSGGPQSVNSADASRINFSLQDCPVPVLGICYGHQLIAHISGGSISSGSSREYGYTMIKHDRQNQLLSDSPEEQKVWMSHGDHVQSMPDSFNITASTSSIPVAAYESKNGRIFGVQFHPEVSHTEYGIRILDNFISICTTERNWLVKNFKEQLIEEVRVQARDKKLLILLSGGVDSLVAMELCLAAIGSQRVYAIHIDTGFMRYNESNQIIEHFKLLGYDNLQLIQAEERYLNELRKVTDPEEKRLIIGRLFVDIANEALSRLNKEDFLLVQGTIYPDTIESGASDKSAKIKTHHNRVDEIAEMIAAGRIIEPIKDLYKDEVRELGIALSIPEELVNRHPFPGPGLAIRILANQDDIQPDLAVETHKLNELIKSSSIRANILPVKSVGVMGDFRTYNHPVLLSFEDIKLHNWDELRNYSRDAINRLDCINRALFCYSSESVDFKLKQHFLTKKACDELRTVDNILMEMAKDIKEIWQMPVVQLPLFDKDNAQVYVMRPVTSIDAMTADFYEMDIELFQRMRDKVIALPFAAELLFDITSKPPATIEWE